MREHPGNERVKGYSIIDSSNIARDTVRGTEDRLVSGHGVVAVLDGVSNRNGARMPDSLSTPGQFATSVGAHALLEASRAIERGDLPAEPKSVVDFLTKALRDAIPEGYAGFPPEFVFAAYFPMLKSVLLVGDCGCRIAGETPQETAARNPGLVLDSWRASVRAEGGDFSISQQQEHENRLTHLGYGVISGKAGVPDVPALHIRVVPIPEGSSVILFSDGYPADIIRDSLSETESAYSEHRRAALARDPKAREDDRSYIRFTTRES